MRRTDYEIPEDLQNVFWGDIRKSVHDGDSEVADYDPSDYEDGNASGALHLWAVNRYPSGSWAHRIRPLTDAEAVAVLRATVERLLEEQEEARPLWLVGLAVRDAVKAGKIEVKA